jgi:hypothetical protein
MLLLLLYSSHSAESDWPHGHLENAWWAAQMNNMLMNNWAYLIDGVCPGQS